MNNVDRLDLNAVRLQQAVLCVDCEVISDSPSANCLVCGSLSLLPLARVLNGEERPGVAAAGQQRETGQQSPAQVLVLVPTSPHRRSQRGHLRS